MFVQKIKKEYSSSLEIAEKYYSILSTLNNLDLTKREVQLLAFIATRGTISSVTSREEFCSIYDSSTSTINNLVSRLRSIKLLYKDGLKVKVNPAILPDFSSNLGLLININSKNDE